MLSGSRTLGTLLSVAMATILGCAGDDVDYRDDLEFDFGVGSGDRYVAFEDNSVCQVAYYVQGGYFVMASLRTNVPAETLLPCGLQVGDEIIAEDLVHMRQGANDVIGGLILPIFPGTPERVGEVDGLSALLYCDVEGEQVDVRVTLEVVYADSESSWDLEEVSSASIAE